MVRLLSYSCDQWDGNERKFVNLGLNDGTYDEIYFFEVTKSAGEIWYRARPDELHASLVELGIEQVVFWDFNWQASGVRLERVPTFRTTKHLLVSNFWKFI